MFVAALVCITVASIRIRILHDVNICDPTTSGYDGDFTITDDDTIYATVSAGIAASAVDGELYDMVTHKAFTTEAIEYALNNGYMLGYIDRLKQGGWIPQDFTPAGASAQAQPTTDTSGSSEGSSQAAQSTQTAASETKQKEAPIMTRRYMTPTRPERNWKYTESARP